LLVDALDVAINRSLLLLLLLLLTFATDAVDLPDRVLSRLFADTVDPHRLPTPWICCYALDLAIARQRR
jgi:hypothetical protein